MASDTSTLRISIRDTLRAAHPAMLGSPFVEGQVADAKFAAHFFCPKLSLMFVQYPYDLFFAETDSLHRQSPHLEDGLASNAEHLREAGQLKASSILFWLQWNQIRRYHHTVIAPKVRDYQRKRCCMCQQIEVERVNKPK